MIIFHLDIVESALVVSISNPCNGAARLPFKARQAHLLHVLLPVNLAGPLILHSFVALLAQR